MTDQELLKSILTTNILKLNALYEIREILCLQNNMTPNAYASSVENTAEYCKLRQENILKLFEDE